MSRPVVVLANGASAHRALTKKRLELEYRSGTKRKQNIKLALPDFIRSVFHLPKRVVDLLELAVYVFTADRLITRGPADAAVYEAWARSFEFHMRVRDEAFWKRPDVQRALADTLEFMTGDARYSFTFEGGHTTPQAGLFDAEEFVMPATLKPDILLFSGGLDSLAGAIDLLEDGRQVCLVSHRSQSGTMRTQNALAEALANHAPYRNRVRPYHFNCTLHGVKAVEETQRSRAFLYTAISLALQVAFGTDRIHVFENGVTSFNFPRREDQLNARASRTTHPKTMRILEGLAALPEAEAVERIWRLCRQHGLNVQEALREIRHHFDDPYRTVVPDSLVDLIRQREYLKEPAARAVAAFVARAEPQIERLYAGGNRPKNENEFNRGVATILGAVRSDLQSEHPAARFACAGVIPDHELDVANIVVESKYIRDATAPSKVSDGMAADLTKYPQDKHVLFVVYDPEHQIRDTKVFIRDFEGRGRCTVRVLR